LPALPAQASAYSEFDAGIAARNLGLCDIAIAHMTAALGAPDLLASLRSGALLVRGDCLRQTDKNAAALADFDAAIALSPDNFDSHLWRGELLEHLARYDDAAADFSTLIRLRPDLSKGYVSLGELYLAQKKYDEALAQYATLIDVGSDDYLGYLLRAKAYFLKGAYELAMVDADRVVKMAPRASPGHFVREAIYEAQGKLALALSDINLVLEDTPDDVEMRRQKGIILWEMGQFSEATDALIPLKKLAAADGYTILWFDLARVADDEPDRDLESRSAAVNLTKWPGPIVALYLGRETPDDIQSFIAAAPFDERDDMRCQAAFFVGEWQVRHHAKPVGYALLRQAASDCPVDYAERGAAAIELSRLR